MSRITGWRDRWLERRRKAEEAVFVRLNALEAEELERARVAVEEGEEAAEARFPPPSAEHEADLIASLIRVSERDPGRFLRIVDAWASQGIAGLSAEDLAKHAFEAVQARMLTSVTNLFWDEARPGVPTYRPELAAEGRRRGWRR
ncbi:MAG TPA: hypothetical protein VFK59_03435 [Actinomycetota bacterium]|nr:hypothetical protein [Actinomycetota bacterium]